MSEPASPWTKLDYDAIDTAKEPWDGVDVLVYVDIADTDIVRLAWWDDGSLWEMHGMTSPEEDRGWWCYIHSVTQEKLVGRYAPTHYHPAPWPFPKK